MFVEPKVDGMNTKALIDCGANHIFLAEEEAKNLGILYTKESEWLTVVNSPYNLILGAFHGIPMNIA